MGPTMTQPPTSEPRDETPDADAGVTAAPEPTRTYGADGVASPFGPQAPRELQFRHAPALEPVDDGDVVGASGVRSPFSSTPPPTDYVMPSAPPPVLRAPTMWRSWTAIALAIIAFMTYPIIAFPAIGLSWYAMRAQERLARFALILSIAALVIGFLLVFALNGGLPGA